MFQKCAFGLQLVGYIVPDAVWDESNVNVHKQYGLQLSLYSDVKFSGGIRESNHEIV